MNNRKKYLKIVLVTCVVLALVAALTAGLILSQARTSDEELPLDIEPSQTDSVFDNDKPVESNKNDIVLNYSLEIPDYQYGDIIAEFGDGKLATCVEPLETPNFIDGLIEINDDWSIMEHCDLVVKAEVLKNDEICIEYPQEWGDEIITHQAFAGIVTLKINEVYYEGEGRTEIPGIVTVYSDVCSRFMPDGYGRLAEPGEEYYFFLVSSKNYDVPVDYEQLSEYMLSLSSFHGYLIASSETISDQIETILDYNCKLAGIENNFKVGDDLGEALTYLFK